MNSEYLSIAPRERKPRRTRGGAPGTFEVVEPDGTRRTFSAVGRVAQTIRVLVATGGAGITSLEVGGWNVRLADSIHKARHQHGLLISTDREEHHGEYAGLHARYRLGCQVREIECGSSSNRTAA